MKKTVTLCTTAFILTFSLGIAQAETTDASEAPSQDSQTENPHQPDESVPIEQLPAQQHEAEDDPYEPDESVPIEQLPAQQYEADDENETEPQVDSSQEPETLPETGSEHIIVFTLGLSLILLGVSTLKRYQV